MSTTLLSNTIKAESFRTEYRVALAYQYRESDPDTFAVYRFSDGVAMRHYIKSDNQ
jgi:hypothetical protein